jgi:hypothetical protein
MRSSLLFTLTVAALLASLPACGSVPTNTTVTIASLPNQTYVFFDADGKQLAVHHSGSDGAPIVQEIAQGASVTSFASHGAIHLQTVMNLEPGESIDIAAPVSASNIHTVKLPSMMAGRSVEVTLWCNGAATTFTPEPGASRVEISSRCARPTVLAKTIDDTTAVALYQRDMTADAAGIFDLSSTHPIASKSVDIAITGIPLGLTAGIVQLQAFDRDHEVDLGLMGLPVTAKSAVVQILDLGEDLFIAGSVQQRQSRGWQSVGIVQTKAPYSINIDSLLLPWVEAPALDNSTHKISWRTSASGASVDAVSVDLTFNSNDGRKINWEILAPFEGNELTIPALPAGTPIAIGAPTTIKSLKLISVTGGYSKLRTVPFDAIETLLNHGGFFAISTPDDE